MRYALAFLTICVLFVTNSVFAQQKQKAEEAKNSFRQLRQSFQQQQAQPGKAVNPQVAEKERAQSVKTWIKRNNWKELPVQEQAWLCETLAGPDQVDKRSFSVRWTGQLKAPANGQYTFSPYSAAGTEGTMRLWIDDQLVLDTSIATSDDLEAVPEPVEGKKAAVQKETAVAATPQGTVNLTAGKAAAFKLEYIRTITPPKPGVMRLPGFPAAVLEWQSDVMEKQVVPSSVFTPPAGSEEKQGLLGEYFADTELAKRVAVRIDPNVDFLWDVGRVTTENRDSQREIVSATVAKLTSPGFLASLGQDEAKDLIQKRLTPLFAVMSASERIAVMQTIGEQPELLKLLSFSQMAGALRWYSTLADSAPAIDLLVKWSKTSQPPIAKPGFAPGRSPGGYLTQNVEPYFRLARLFLGDDVDQKIEMLSEHVANEDGSCNLTVAYVLCCVCRMAGKSKVMGEITDAHLLGEENEKKPGDIRASWFIAEAFKYETVYGSEFKPGAGIKPIEKALEVAESEAMRFRLTGELAARLIALDRADEARSMIMSVRDQFADESEQEQMDAWLVRGDEVKKYYEDIRVKRAEEADTFVSEQYAQELKRRAVVAEKRGEGRSLQRYQRSISALEKVQEEKKKAAKN